MASNNIFSSSDEDFDIFPVRRVIKPKKSKRKLNLSSPTVSTENAARENIQHNIESVSEFNSEDEPVNLPKKICRTDGPKNIYLSPGTGNQLQILENVRFSPKTHAQKIRVANKQSNSRLSSPMSTPGSISALCNSSRCPSLSNITDLIRFDGDENRLTTPTRKNNTASNSLKTQRVQPTTSKLSEFSHNVTSEEQFSLNSESAHPVSSESLVIPVIQENSQRIVNNSTFISDSSENIINNLQEKQAPYKPDNFTREQLVQPQQEGSSSEGSSSKDSSSEGSSSVNSTDDDSTDVDEREQHTESDTSPNEERFEVEENQEDEDGWIDISEDLPTIDRDTEIQNGSINIPTTTKTPEEIYRLFLTDEILQKIVDETNKYAEIQKQQNLKPKARMHAWKPTDTEEMCHFFAVIFVMGLNKVPTLNDYWSKKSIYRNDYIISIMKRDRFLLLLKCLHFSDVIAQNTTDKLCKIRDVVDMLTQRFQEVLTPGKFVVVDESMIPWRGRLSFRQYIKNKTHKYGVKLYKICTPEGYTYNAKLYTGKGDSGPEYNHGQKTVMRLLTGLENACRIVIADNFYSSIGLAEELLSRKTFYCGTLRSNRRGLPKNTVTKKIKKGDVFGKMNEKGVRIIKWFDKRPILMISTCNNHNPTLVNTGKKDRQQQDIKKPQCILTYNENKKGIDYSDQMSNYYTTLRRGLKWYRKVMIELLFGVSLINAWIVYNMSNAKKVSKKEFTELLIEALSGKNISGKNSIEINKGHQFLKTSTRKNCVGCYEKLRKTLTSKQADKKIKKIKSGCNQCHKSYCLPCFNEKHFK